MTQMSKRRTTNRPGARSGGEIADLMQARFFKALCDPNRIAIVARLSRRTKPCCVSRVADCCPVDISVVSRHLSILRDAGILRAERRGKEVRYAVRFSELSSTLRAMADAIDACCPKKVSVRKKRGSP